MRSAGDSQRPTRLGKIENLHAEAPLGTVTADAERPRISTTSRWWPTIGYGIDYAERYRGLRDIRALPSAQRSQT